MSEVYNDAASRLWWGMRRYAAIFLVIVPLTTLIAFVAVRGTPLQKSYQTSALVIATERQFPPELFARLADAVFTGGTVAERAVSEGRLGIDPRKLIPTYASLEPVQDNIIIKVIGENRNAELSARIANATATALVEELNQSGRGVGVFAVQDHARVPTTADTSSSRALPLIVGVIAGFLLGGGIIGLILTVRRPLLGAGEAAELVGAPVLGTPILPAVRGGRPIDVSAVKGLASLAKRIMPARPAVVALAACGGEGRYRTLLAQMISSVLAERGAVFLIPSAEQTVAGMYSIFAPPANVMVSEHIPDGKVWRMAGVVIDGPSANEVDLPQVLPSRASIVLVVAQGTPMSQVRDAAEQFLPGELEGIVFIRRSAAWPWYRSPSAVTATSMTTAAGVDAWAGATGAGATGSGATPTYGGAEHAAASAAEIRLEQIEQESTVARVEARYE